MTIDLFKNKKENPIIQDVFEKTAEDYFQSTGLPHDKIRIFTLANQLASATLDGGTDMEKYQAALTRVKRLQDAIKPSNPNQDRPTK